MKKVLNFSDFLLFILGFLVAVLMLTSCSKPNDQLARPGSDNEPRIEFQYNGALKQYFDISAGSSKTSGVRYYTFVGTKTPANNTFSMTILTDSLRAGTYNMNTGVVTFHEGTTVATNGTTNFTVTITSNVNGLVNGTFTGSLKDQTNSTVACLQGKIENVQLLYR